MSESHLHPVAGSGLRILVEPPHQQARQFLTGRIGKNQVADFAARRSVILANVLRYPKRKFAMSPHEAQQVAWSQKADLAGFLNLGGGFIGAPGDDRCNPQWVTRLDHSQNQSLAVAATDGELHPASAHEEHPPSNLPFREQDSARRVGGGNCFLLQGLS